MNVDPRVSPQELIKDYGQLVSSLAYQFFGNQEDAREAAQEAWVEILGALPGFQGKSSLSTWIHTVAWRRLLKWKKTERKHSLMDLRTHYQRDQIADPHRQGPELRQWVEETCRRCMTGVLFCLSSRQRLVFLLRLTAALPYPEIADILNTTAGNARKLYSRARAILAEFLSADCAHVSRTASCAYGMDRYIRTTALNETFELLRRFGTVVEAYRILPQAMPGPNYWESCIFPPS